MTGRIAGSAGAEQLQSLSRTLERTAEPASKPERSGEPSGFQQALGSLGREIDKGEKLVQRALRGGGQLGAADLIALQAGIYRYSEAVDLAAKLVDRAGNAVRTTLQSNGG
jgi:hypothetical protein